MHYKIKHCYYLCIVNVFIIFGHLMYLESMRDVLLEPFPSTFHPVDAHSGVVNGSVVPSLRFGWILCSCLEKFQFGHSDFSVFLQSGLHVEHKTLTGCVRVLDFSCYICQKQRTHYIIVYGRYTVKMLSSYFFGNLF